MMSNISRHLVASLSQTAGSGAWRRQHGQFNVTVGCASWRGRLARDCAQ